MSGDLEISFTVQRRDFPVAAELTIPTGEHLVLFGPSGAGKTTVIEAIAGLVRIEGTIRLGSQVLTESGPPYSSIPLHRRRVGLVRQDPALFPHLTVAENIGFARRLPVDAPAILQIGDGLGLAGMLSSLPAALSGGQRQRVALARVLASDYATLLLDEPYTGLDQSLARELTRRAVESTASVPSIMVTHDLDAAQSFGDRIAVLDHGRVLQVADPRTIVVRPATRRVAELVGYRGFAGLGGLGDRRVAGIHPDRVVPGAFPERGVVLEGAVRTCRPSGAGHELELNTSGSVVVVRLPAAAQIGEYLTVTALDPPFFPEAGR